MKVRILFTVKTYSTSEQVVKDIDVSNAQFKLLSNTGRNTDKKVKRYCETTFPMADEVWITSIKRIGQSGGSKNNQEDSTSNWSMWGVVKGVLKLPFYVLRTLWRLFLWILPA